MAVAAACFRAKLAGQPAPAGERTARVLAGYRRTAGDQATAARSIVELKAELDTLKALESLALGVRRRSADTKWRELGRACSARSLRLQGGTAGPGSRRFATATARSRGRRPLRIKSWWSSPSTGTRCATCSSASRHDPARPPPAARPAGAGAAGHRRRRRRHQPAARPPDGQLRPALEPRTATAAALHRIVRRRRLTGVIVSG